MTFLAWSALIVLASCEKINEHEPDYADHVRHAVLLYSAGYNSLSYDMDADIQEMTEGYLPSKGSTDGAVLVYSKKTVSSGNYKTPTDSYLIRLYRNKKGAAVMDTVHTWSSDYVAASSRTVNEVLSYVKTNYPADSYGLIFSSHATGWLPAGYYSSGKITDFAVPFGTGHADGLKPVPFVEIPREDGEPRVKSIGADNINSSSTYEMEVNAFASSIPMYLDYIIMDCCLMGGVEVAYELKGVCGKLIFSQTEVLADGLCNYTNVIGRLLNSSEPDLKGLCEDAYTHYDSQSGSYRSLTISMIDCAKLGPLAEACAKLFSDYRGKMALVNPSSVQHYFRYNKHWFYDLEDILVQSGASEEDLKSFRTAMSRCVLYNEATPSFLGIPIKTHCGLSMYLPADGDPELDTFYRTLSWNNATHLVL